MQPLKTISIPLAIGMKFSRCIKSQQIKGRDISQSKVATDLVRNYMNDIGYEDEKNLACNSMPHKE